MPHIAGIYTCINEVHTSDDSTVCSGVQKWLYREFVRYMCFEILYEGPWCLICLFQAGDYVQDDVVSTLIQLIAETNSLHCYTTQQLFKALKTDISQQPLCQVGSWCLGEYGDIFMAGNLEEEEPVNVSRPHTYGQGSGKVNSIIAKICPF